MFTRPAAIEDATIIAAVRAGWQFDAVAVDYLAAGFGSHHWVASAADGTRRFLTVDNLAGRDFFGDSPPAAFDALSTAFAVAHELGGALDWVVGPLADTDGRVVRWLGEEYTIAVFPYVEGTTAEQYASDVERGSVVALIAELHQSTGALTARARREVFRLPNRADLEAALRSLDDAWTGGPYSEPARALLRQHANGVRRVLGEYDDLAQEALRDQTEWTITHGEPHSANVMRTNDDLRVIDWDTALLAPPERDLWMLLPPSGPDLLGQRYTEITRHAVNEDLLRLYALWWDLCEIGIYLAEFRAIHTDTEDSRVAWQGLQQSIQVAPRWPG